MRLREPKPRNFGRNDGLSLVRGTIHAMSVLEAAQWLVVLNAVAVDAHHEGRREERLLLAGLIE